MGLSNGAAFGFPRNEAGWRLENWVAYLVLGCKLGYYAAPTDDHIRTLLYQRARPIAAAFSITIDVPDHYHVPHDNSNPNIS